MICQRCLQRLASRPRSGPLRLSTRPFSQSSPNRSQAVTAQETTATNPRPHDKPAATSTSAAQPFSAGLHSDVAVVPKKTKPAAKVVSSVPAGTVLKGLNFMKTKQDPVALADHEYPPWLWTVLEQRDGVAGATDDAEGDLFSKSKKQRRIAAKALRKQHLLNPDSLAPKVPIYEQTVDLPGGDGTVQGNKDAYEAQHKLTKAMREKRRNRIKEDNFLKSM